MIVNKKKAILNKTLIALAVAASIASCQNLDREKVAVKKESQEASSAENDKEGITLDELLRDVRNHEQIQSQVKAKREHEFKANSNKMVRVTGARIASGSIQYYKPMGIGYSQPPQNTENYNHYKDNGVYLASETPVSTFSIDVDTASYANVRRMINDGYLPPKDAVRLEEFVNYFDYQFPTADDKNTPFSVSTDTMSAPWNQNAQLIQIGIKGFEPEDKPLPPSNLVFLVDVSGSMQSAKKLGLVKKALKLLANKMTENDRVSLVVYAGASGVVLEPTSGKETFKIEQAIDQLQAGGSTNGASGIKLAYQMAEKAFIKKGINRVILATDGDFNVGMTNHEQLIELIESKRNSNVFFSSLGFGAGNYNDHLVEQLANKGNGNAFYIDSLQEAKKVLVDQRAGTLMTIAKDVKIQVEFNPRVVSEYRLLGYENRVLNREDFNNDKVDAGEIGAGHTITALYEVALNNSAGKKVDPLRYGAKELQVATDRKLISEAAMVKLRYKLPTENKSKLLEQPVYTSAFNKDSANNNIQFAASVAGFAQLLRGGQHLENWNWNQAIKSAKSAKGLDDKGYRAEMIKLMELAQLISDKDTDSSSVGMLDD